MSASPGPLHRFFSSALLWGSAAVALLGCAVYIGWQAVQQGDVLTQQAFESARQVKINIATGEMQGAPPAVPAPKPPEPPPAAAPPTPAPEAAPATPPAAAPEAAPAATPAPAEGAAPAPPAEVMPPPAAAPAPAEPASPPVPVQPAEPAAPAAPAEPAEPAAPPQASGPSPAAAMAASPGSSPLAEAPAEGFSENTPQGVLPIVAADGTKPWQYYARPFVRTQNRPAIALVLTGVGLNTQTSELAASLPDNVSLSLSPYGNDAAIWAKALRAHGHEILLDLPLEPVGYPAVDPGPAGLLTSNLPEQNVERLQYILSRVPGYIGITIPPKERFTANKEAAYPVMQNVNKRGLLFVLAVIPDKSVEELFKYNSFPYLASDLVIDSDLSPASVAKQLGQLEDIARRQGYAIGTARALPVTLQQMSAWAATLSGRNIELVPVSAIAKTKYK